MGSHRLARAALPALVAVQSRGEAECISRYIRHWREPRGCERRFPHVEHMPESTDSVRSSIVTTPTSATSTSPPQAGQQSSSVSRGTVGWCRLGRPLGQREETFGAAHPPTPNPRTPPVEVARAAPRYGCRGTAVGTCGCVASVARWRPCRPLWGRWWHSRNPWGSVTDSYSYDHYGATTETTPRPRSPTHGATPGSTSTQPRGRTRWGPGTTSPLRLGVDVAPQA